MNNDIFISAEIGINHNGDINIAKRLIDGAALAGCNAVKFQKRTIDKVYSPEFLASPRQSPWGTTQRAQKEGLEFNQEEYDEIDAYCRQQNIEWFASAWDVDAQKFLRRYNLKYNKVASPVLTNIPLLEAVAEEKRYTFIATGMSTWEEIDAAVEIFHKYDCPFEKFRSATHAFPLYDAEAEKSILGRYAFFATDISLLAPLTASSKILMVLLWVSANENNSFRVIIRSVG